MAAVKYPGQEFSPGRGVRPARAAALSECMRKITILLVLAGLASTRFSWATPYMASEEEPKERRNELHIGMLAGGADIGDVQGPGIGLEINAGRRFGDISILGQIDYLGVGESQYIADPRRGSLARAGLMARYSVLDFAGDRNPLGVNLWIEAGGGRQRIAWDRGGTLTRSDVNLGFGIQLDARLDNGRRHLGPYFAFRANIAQAPDLAMDSEPTCGGPCDTATAPSSTDLSLFFHFGMHLGRSSR